MKTNKKQHLRHIRFMGSFMNIGLSIMLVSWYIFEMMHRTKKGPLYSPFWALGGNPKIWMNRILFQLKIFIYTLLLTFSLKISIILVFRHKLDVRIDITQVMQAPFKRVVTILKLSLVLISITCWINWSLGDLTSRGLTILTLCYSVYLIIELNDNLYKKALYQFL